MGRMNFNDDTRNLLLSNNMRNNLSGNYTSSHQHYRSTYLPENTINGIARKRRNIFSRLNLTQALERGKQPRQSKLLLMKNNYEPDQSIIPEETHSSHFLAKHMNKYSISKHDKSRHIIQLTFRA
jgi:hypothetical protein